jgi:MtN3 and saliva related transmembrane protein
MNKLLRKQIRGQSPFPGPPRAATLQIWTTKSAKDISLKMFVAFCTGVALWLAYGILQAEIPIIIWNAVTLLLALAIVVMKIKYG